MEFKKQIDQWYLKFRQYFFRYTKGFYELPMLVNSPEVMIQGFSKMRFAKYDKEKQLFSTNNPFFFTEFIHLKLEDGLILYLAKSVFKKNVKLKFLYNKHIPSEYYFLHYQITTKEKQKTSALSNGIPYSVNTWLFYKPGCYSDHYYFKGTEGVFFTVYFTKAWLEKFLENCTEDQKKGIAHFLNSSQEYIIYPDDNRSNSYLLFQDTLIAKPAVADMNIKEFRKVTYNILGDFLYSLNEGSVTDNFFLLTNNERLKIIQAEKYLRKYLGSEFPGIEHIADKVGITQTSLKNGFKLIYGRSVYKYYQAEKMQLAADRLYQNPAMKIAQLAQEMGYENASKFSAAFKENIGVTPREYISSMVE